ncbi:MAG: hypothetical protein OES47_13540 [Acidobacteriota bacterium]|nr:hypothetical protein [Acidobacteriota bacterium]
MVAFASLFLSLVVGPQHVELLVGDSVALVEVLLDDERVGVLSGEPWSIGCDFGERLVPHELVAVAYDDQRNEIGRARQWVNLPRSSAEASIILEREGAKVFARLTWTSVEGADPLAVTIRFDGKTLPLDDTHRAELPKHDLEQLHFLRAELEFADNVSAVAEMTFGGSYADDTRTDLTAVAVQLEPGRKLLSVEKLQGLFQKADEVLTVVATEKGPATVLVVRDERSRVTLGNLARSDEAAKRRQRRTLFGGGVGIDSVSQQSMMALGEYSLRFVWPVARTNTSLEQTFEVFDFSPPFDSKDGGMYWLLAQIEKPFALTGPERLSDAVAIAGVVAARRNRRRAVILLSHDDTSDPSRLDTATVRDYLETLMVPVLVWSAGDQARDGARDGADVWGEGIDVSSLRKLERATRDLNRKLDRQRLVWIEGVHLPQDIRLSDQAKMKLAR